MDPKLDWTSYDSEIQQAWLGGATLAQIMSMLRKEGFAPSAYGGAVGLSDRLKFLMTDLAEAEAQLKPYLSLRLSHQAETLISIVAEDLRRRTSYEKRTKQVVDYRNRSVIELTIDQPEPVNASTIRAVGDLLRFRADLAGLFDAPTVPLKPTINIKEENLWEKHDQRGNEEYSEEELFGNGRVH